MPENKVSNRISAGPEGSEVQLDVPRPNEFQNFVTGSLGHKLSLYGYNLFNHHSTTFAPLDRIPVGDDYVIGPGDQLLIRTWGQVDLNAKLNVDRSGEVFLPKIGTLMVAGLKYQQLQDYFHTAIGRVYRNFELTVSLGELRSIQIFVVGQARRPGSYTVSSLSTLVNALFASGGPSASGSMRHVQLKREDHIVSDFDFYDLLLKGDKSKDVKLLPGDVLYIPPVGALIAIDGSVNVPAIYELRDDVTLEHTIEMAGGLATTADGKKVVVERIQDRSVRTIEEFSLDAEGKKRAVRDGDLVRIFPLSPRFKNAVTLRGNVAHPGRFAWHEGMHLSDLLPDQDALLTGAYWRKANSLSVREEDESAREKLKNSADGEGNPVPMPDGLGGDPIRPPPPTEIKVSAPAINWDYAVIQRLSFADLTTRLVPFNLGRLILERDQTQNLALEAGDIVTVFSQADLAVPLQLQTKFIHLEGEFASAGVYRAEPGENLRKLIQRVGGFTSYAYLYGADFTRESVRIKQQKALDQMAAKLEEDISRSALAPAAAPDQVVETQAKLEAQHQLVGKLSQLRASGRVVLDLKVDSTGLDAVPEISLEDGDRFSVPFRPSTVEVLGAVYNENSFLFRNQETMGEYLKKAGGATRDADTERTFVIRADGSVINKQSVNGLWHGGLSSLRLMPGDAIIVPERLSHGSVLRGLRDWSQVFAQFALGAAAIRVVQ